MTTLHMLSLTVALGPLRQLAAVHGVAPDEGRMLHHALGECFGRGAIQPFRLLPGRNASRHGTLYGYTGLPPDDLRDRAASLAPPDLMALFDLPGLAIKPMPDGWRAGRRLAFDLRCLPVRRLLRPLSPWSDEAARATPYARGAEVDVYLVDAMRRHPDGLPPDLDRLRLREDLYRAWLAERLAPAACLHAETTRLTAFRRLALRRGSGRQTAPEATLHGELTITDAGAFARMLARGVGRHTAYGFGMLLLRPARG